MSEKNEQNNDEQNEELQDSNANLDSANESLDEVESNEEINKDLKIKELEDKYLRAYAEFENIKKRLERDKYQALEYANESILKDFLPILDTLESALKGIDTSKEDSAINSIIDGIKLTIDNFTKVFNKHSVEVISTDGEFDPNLHNAIMQVNDETKQDGEIAQVIQKGYKYKDRVIRPSMVAITKNN
ncbi:nucleotide exchange factor GrpE [Helicobacter sp. MIT 14-3879]|uniref:nucleotide exchange factor GrpE n=1 Tax=Helicobacter sp. MIT 14-3879 TaxID=2040649 RepID=UPI000E1ED579|nr:nucleotide exchange factor GrpE [Helicobacter sp. MIT 14-3879]RDU62441.1 nucleotide exchange factor GrpE [Helicobacter sp. MIT 14-3879]